MLNFDSGETPSAGLASWITFDNNSLGGSYAISYFADQVYINASPPYDMGDGQVHGFVFAQVEKGSGRVIALYSADVPPWVYNGPTDVRPHYVDSSTGKKYRRRLPQITLADVASGKYTIAQVLAAKREHRDDGYKRRAVRAAQIDALRRQLDDHKAAVAAAVKAASDMSVRAHVLGTPKAHRDAERAWAAHKLAVDKYTNERTAVDRAQSEFDTFDPMHQWEEITQDQYHKDMPLLPHPFATHDPEKHEVVLLDPMHEFTQIAMEMQNASFDQQKALHDLIYSGKVHIGNGELQRKGPPGVKTVPIHW